MQTRLDGDIDVLNFDTRVSSAAMQVVRIYQIGFLGALGQAALFGHEQLGVRYRLQQARLADARLSDHQTSETVRHGRVVDVVNPWK